MPKLGTWIPLVALLALASSLPFELDQPLAVIGPLAITNVELLLALALGLAFTAAPPAQWVRPGRAWWALLLFGGWLLLSALLAPQFAGNALKASLRLLTGVALAVAVWQIVRQPRHGRLVALALLGGGLLAAGIGWWEIQHGELGWVALFRGRITRVGPFARLTGPFDYANQTAMFIEATLPFIVAGGWHIYHSAWSRWAKIPLLMGVGVTAVGYLHTSVLTLSRASFATIVIVCLLVAVWLAIPRTAHGRQMALWWLGLGVLAAVITLGQTLLSNQMRLRLQGGNVDEWYKAEVIAPATLTIATHSVLDVPVTITNNGSFAWHSEGQNPIQLGARWFNAAGEPIYAELRWPFSRPVEAGETVQLRLPLPAPPEAGTHELRWDVVHENVAWFGDRSGRVAITQVTAVTSAGQVDAPATATAVGERQQLAAPPTTVPSRTTLWRLGLAMVRERPWLGIGFDNFRLTYGARLDSANFDDTVHTNNFYLEMLVSVGLLGGGAFLFWLGALVVDVLQTLHQPDVSIWQAAVGAGLLAFLVHGLLDFFLLFNATGLLFWLLVGLWVSEKQLHAYRI